jgi:hypothetical protein
MRANFRMPDHPARTQRFAIPVRLDRFSEMLCCDRFGSNTTIRLFRPFAFAVVSATLCGVLPSFAQEANAAKPATIWYAEQFTVHSRAVGRDFLIQVARPVRPQAGKVPVIYVLDGNSLFGEAADMVTSYGYFGDTASAYVVGIGYPTRDFGEWLSLRNRDLLHVRIPDKLAAGSG